MTEDRFQNLERSVQRIETAVCGDSGLNVPGLSKDVGALKDWRDSVKLKWNLIIGGVTVAWFILCIGCVMLWEWVKIKLDHQQ